MTCLITSKLKRRDILKAVHIFGHNAVLVRDKEGKKCLVTGKGIGFMKDKGDKINPQLIQNMFIEDEDYDETIAIHN